MAAPSPADPTAVMGRRIGAFVVDLAIVFAVALLAARFIADFQRETIPPEFTDRDNVCTIVEQSQAVSMCFTNGEVAYYATGADAETSMIGLPLLVSFLNSVVLAAATGATIGKHTFGLRVARNGTSAPAGIGRHLVRWLLWVVDGFPWFIPLVGLVTGFGSPRHRRVGDLVAGTAVVARAAAGRPFGAITDDEPMAAWPTPPTAPDGAPTTPTAPSIGPLYPPIEVPETWDAPWAPPAGTAADDAGDVAPVREPVLVADAPAARPDEHPAELVEATLPLDAIAEHTTDPPAGGESDLPTTGPQWDAARNAYIQWEPVSGQWMQYDDAAATWRPLS